MIGYNISGKGLLKKMEEGGSRRFCALWIQNYPLISVTIYPLISQGVSGEGKSGRGLIKMWQGSKSGGEIIFNSHYYPHSNAIFGDKFLYVTCDNAILRILMFRPRTFFEGYKIFSLQVTKTRNNRGVLLPNIYAALKISVTMFRNKKSH